MKEREGCSRLVDISCIVDKIRVSKRRLFFVVLDYKKLISKLVDRKCERGTEEGCVRTENNNREKNKGYYGKIKSEKNGCFVGVRML